MLHIEDIFDQIAFCIQAPQQIFMNMLSFCNDLLQKDIVSRYIIVLLYAWHLMLPYIFLLIVLLVLFFVWNFIIRSLKHIHANVKHMIQPIHIMSFALALITLYYLHNM